ncbi:hypothetical protein FH972_017179 [Carpinus fangiana]|uniref:Leucine-rich repeat-containing N-terminal plant-type domain-containing protein n=1 Tax=Carpinus fangiana TaxID=176857 RepID=A0A5N6RK77_9ROSI|nr:hypothetical protein FH972_017179 [Carpinus fangiana]
MFGQSEVLVAPIEEQPYIQHCHVQKTCSVGSVIGLDLTNEAITGGRDNLSSLFNLQNLRKLSLAHNNFNGSQIPSEFEKMTNLNYLNLSNAGFAGQIPVEISCLTRSVSLDLSSVYFSDTTTLKLENSSLNVLIQNLTELVELNLDGVNISAQGNQWCQALSSSLPNLRVLSLSNCYLSGPIDSTLLKLQSLSIICLDNNNLSTPIPEFFANFTNLTSLRLSSSGMRGTFPRKIFQVPTLEILDLSNNRLLHGPLPDFPQNGSLRTLVLSNTDFSGILSDSIRGQLPKSLANCTDLEVLNIGNNLIKDFFPCYLKNTSILHVLVLQSNNFSGHIGRSEPNAIWPMLQIVDVASNNFTGKLPKISMWKAMMDDENEAQSDLNHLQFEVLRYNQFYYQDTITVTSKGLDMEPNSIISGKLDSARVIRLSINKLTGEILEELVDGLIFLSFLNISNNQLVGRIPEVKQFATFSEDSYTGNKGLCGFPLKVKCGGNVSPPAPKSRDSSSTMLIGFDWQFIVTGLGFGVGAAVVVAPLMFWEKGRRWYDESIDKILQVQVHQPKRGGMRT